MKTQITQTNEHDWLNQTIQRDLIGQEAKFHLSDWINKTIEHGEIGQKAISTRSDWLKQTIESDNYFEQIPLANKHQWCSLIGSDT